MIKRLLLIIATIGFAYLTAQYTQDKTITSSTKSPGNFLVSLFNFSGFENDSLREQYFILLDSAKLYLSQNETDSAKEFASKALIINQKHPEAFYVQGLLFESQKDFSNALYYYKQARKKDRKHVQARLHSAIALTEMGEYYEADELIMDLVEEGHDFFDLWYHAGKLNYIWDYYSVAESYLLDALAHDSESAEVYHYLALVTEKLERPDEAMKYAETAITKNEYYLDALLNKGRLHSQREEYRNALESYNQALQSNDSLAYIYIDRAWVFSQLNNYNAALADYEQAIKLEPKNTAIYTNRGYTFYKMGDYDKALKDLDLSIAWNSENEWGHFYRGLVCYTTKRYEDARADFEQVTYLNPQNYPAYFNIALCWDALGADTDALTAWENYVYYGENEENLQYAQQRIDELTEKLNY